ncbi:hypothetical protein VCRA2110O135_170033 [Vibrio crassostreae]|nr:hypothetical protein VCRA2110O135_170033 [Vibrio crassostreae]
MILNYYNQVSMLEATSYSPQVRGNNHMGDYRSSSHVYWRCKYHIVWSPK